MLKKKRNYVDTLYLICKFIPITFVKTFLVHLIADGGSCVEVCPGRASFSGSLAGPLPYRGAPQRHHSGEACVWGPAPSGRYNCCKGYRTQSMLFVMLL